MSTPFVRVGAAASRRLRREGRNVVPRIHESFPVVGEVPVSAHTVGSSEILDALEEDLPVTMFDSDSHISRNVLCEVNNTNQRSSRRLVLCVDRGPTQESMAEVTTAHDSVETTPKDGEPGSEEDHPRHTQMEDVADTDSVGSVTTVVAEAIPDDPAEEDDRESLWSVGGDLESADDVEEEIPFRHPGVRSCQLGFRSLDVVQLCDAFEQRGCLMQNVPRFLRGPFRRALRVATTR